MKNNPLVSIITPTYNSEATIADMLWSVVCQSYGPLEHIIVDGASSDDTLKEIDRFRHLYYGDKELRIVSTPDNGMYHAMNRGLAMAKGKVIGFLNSDDFFSSNDALSRLMIHLKPDVDAVYANLHYVSRYNINRVRRIYSSRIFSRIMMLVGLQPAHPTFYCRRECYERFGPFDTDFKVAADFEQLLRMIYIGRINIRFVPFDCVTMRMGGVSTSGLRSFINIRRDHLKAYHKNHIPANRFTDALRYFWKIGEIIAPLWCRFKNKPNDCRY